MSSVRAVRRLGQAGLGDAEAGDSFLRDAGPTYQAWANQMQALGGEYGTPDAVVVTTWPSSFGDHYSGLTAARFPVADYVASFNGGYLDTGAVQRTTADGQYAYVLAPSDVQDDSPTTAPLWARAMNAGFTGLDTAASAAGLPSLTAIESWLTGAGKWAAVGAAGLVALYLMGKRR